ncbi:hypothetical protein FGD71_001180 [Streptomyces sporangiiformans]|uniref:Oligopeptide/dipeptide ABC transporter C-terminal domain-containing protein n=1 Tax=Streptomyces sporangiiformans TaxID=2315329 RepID=A0A505DS09_9ACTN|nr:hypothetical protein FGD71_001180 [Streptomyces sporangiiformans]
MYLGRTVESGPAEGVFERPHHPCTAALLSAAPSLAAGGRANRRRILLTGEIPSPADPPSGCSFRTRCWRAEDVCAEASPHRRSEHRSTRRHATSRWRRHRPSRGVTGRRLPERVPRKAA